MNPPVIRTAVPEDAQAILELWRLAGAFPTRTDNEESVCSLIAAYDGWRGALSRMAVLPAYRRLGIARALLVAGERSLLERGAARINTYAIKNEDAAIGFWNAVGYDTDDRARRFVKNLKA